MIVAGVLIVGAVVFSGGSVNRGANVAALPNISIVEGKQIITVHAKGGYSPSITEAKANIPTVLRMQTDGTFDCTSVLTIPMLEYRGNLPPSGITEIEIPPQQVGSSIKGICGMGMKNFSIRFN